MRPADPLTRVPSPFLSRQSLAVVLGSILIAIPIVALCHQAERARLRG
jgi:hypothetical protein